MKRQVTIFIIGALLGSIFLGNYSDKPTSAITLSAPRYITTEVDSSGWQLRSEHFSPYGMPQLLDNRYDFIPKDIGTKIPGISVLVREGFVIGYSDMFKAPIWVSVHWTRDDFKKSQEALDVKRRFEPDMELPEYARATNRYAHSGYQRGHMARNKDNLAWGEDNTLKGDLMSNIVPQTANLNEKVWANLENAARNIVTNDDYPEIWVISGAVYDGLKPIATVANGVGVPSSTYKIISWFDFNGKFYAQGFVMSQDATDIRSERYIVSIRSIEERVGINFFPGLPKEDRQRVEDSTSERLWQTS